MHLGETILVLGALVIFSMTALYLNNSKLNNETRMMESEFRLTAIGIAQSFIEEAQRCAYDEVLISSAYNTLPNDLTDIPSLGPESGEAYPHFDDIDDFNGLAWTIDTPRADYTVNIRVSYADSVQCAPGNHNRSFFKMLSATVKSAFYQDSITCQYLFTYH